MIGGIKKQEEFIMNSQYDRRTFCLLIMIQLSQALMMTGLFFNKMNYKIIIFSLFLVLTAFLLILHSRAVRKEKILLIESNKLVYDQEIMNSINILELVITHRNIKIQRLNNNLRKSKIRISLKDQKEMDQFKKEIMIFGRDNGLKVTEVD